MSTMSIIDSEKQISAYQRLCRYCFTDSIGWTDHIFPLPGNGSYGLAFFDDEGHARSGMADIRFTTRYFGEDWSSGGISAVASDPADRNSGRIREILNEVLRRDYQTGVGISYLYPFSYRFYGKFGYGSLGDYKQYRFAPEDIRKIRTGFSFAPMEWKETEFNTISDLHNLWIQQFDASIYWPYRSFQEERESARRFNHYYYVIHDTSGELAAWLRFSQDDDYQNPGLYVHKAVWRHAQGLAAIFEFLARHRSQISKIELSLPGSFQARHFLNEPRPEISCVNEWMARPVNIPKVFSAAVAQFAASKEGENQPLPDAGFYLTDPVIGENSGIYRISGGKLEFTPSASPPDGMAEIDLSVFSSLLFGGISLEQAVLTGLTDESDLPGMDQFFSGRNAIFITDRF